MIHSVMWNQYPTFDFEPDGPFCFSCRIRGSTCIESCIFWEHITDGQWVFVAKLMKLVEVLHYFLTIFGPGEVKHTASWLNVVSWLIVVYLNHDKARIHLGISWYSTCHQVMKFVTSPSLLFYHLWTGRIYFVLLSFVCLFFKSWLYCMGLNPEDDKDSVVWEHIIGEYTSRLLWP